MTDMMPEGWVRLPFSKLKPGMRVGNPHIQDPPHIGTLLAKHKGTETLKVLWDDSSDPIDGLPATNYAVAPTDALDQIHPMLANNIKDYATLTVARLIADDAWRSEKKYDGERSIIKVTPPPVKGLKLRSAFGCRFTSRVVGKNSGRLGDNTEHLPHLTALFKHAVPEDGPTVFDGELTSTKFRDDEMNFKHVASVMRSLAPRAVEVQKAEGWLSIRLYDMLWFNGINLREQPFSVRRAALESWYQAMCDWYVQNDDREGLRTFASLVTLSPQALSTEQKQAMHDLAAAEGWEGVMFKHSDGVYTDTSKKEQRSRHLLKDKPFKNTEVIIVEFIGGQGEYNTGKFGAMRFAQWIPRDQLTAAMAEGEVSLNGAALHPNIRLAIHEAGRTGRLHTHALVEVGTASGFSQAEEAAFRADPASFIGAVATMRYQQRITESARMRHPFFKALRDGIASNAVIYDPSKGAAE